jgi:general stress protein 26
VERRETIVRLGDMIRGINVAMLTTVEDDGSLRSRPMATQDTEFDGVLWFFTKLTSAKTHEILHDQHVNLSYADVDNERYVSVSGRATVIQDPDKAEELWLPVHKAWFPKGLDDPELALIRVQVDKAEYWDPPSSTMVQVIGLARALATGKAYNPDDHEKLKL